MQKRSRSFRMPVFFIILKDKDINRIFKYSRFAFCFEHKLPSMPINLFINTRFAFYFEH